jgi:DNA-binding NarL/FixJ family response regulator
MVSVLIINDFSLAREAYVKLLESESDFTVAGQSDCSDESIQAYRKARPDVVLLDLSLPNIDVVSVAQKILHQNPSAKILAISAMDHEAVIRRIKKAGIRGFISKHATAREVAEALRKVATGEEVFPSADSIRKHLSPMEILTPREFEVFRHLASGLTVPQIAALLQSSPKTVGVHQTRIMKKLGTVNTAQLAHIALSSGVINVKSA